MLEQVDLNQKLSREEYQSRIEGLKKELTALDAPIKAAGLPVIILFEGWSGAGKGRQIQKLILNFDPRWFRVVNTQPPTEEELRRPVMWRHWKHIPEKGMIAVLDRSWYQEVSTLRVEQNIDELTNLRRLNDILSFEQGLCDDGYLILKFFLHISKKEMKRRRKKLAADESTAWRVTETDLRREKSYELYKERYESMLEYTDTENAPWHPVSGMNRRAATAEIFRVVIDSVRNALRLKEEKGAAAPEGSPAVLPGPFRLLPAPRLSEINPLRQLPDGLYLAELKKERNRLREYHNLLYLKRIPLIIVYEGWDAAGKGGNIKRVSSALDPRGYVVEPIASPSPAEKNRHFLWRFWQRLPKDGHIAIFDRSWYGRVMVERVEGFCAPAEWRRAYGEINCFERQLADWGAVIVKFWIHISKEEQLSRFEARQRTPEKQWKITSEDWRNREKWPQYEEAVDDMLKYCSTDFAPWHVLEGDCKKWARIKALKIINSAIRERLQ